MPHTIQYASHTHIVEVAISGELTLKELQEAVVQALQLAKEKQCFRLLGDLREVTTVRLTVTDIYELPQTLLSLAQPFGYQLGNLRRATVIPPSLAKPGNFFETVMMNRGQNLRVFQDIEEARAWLLDEA